MAIDFPNSPTLNQQYTVGDRSWTWNGTFWQVTGTTSTFTASDTAPSGPSIGDFWFESDTGKTFVYYDDVWVEVGSASGSIDAGNLAGSTLASSVVNSSLTSVGTLSSLAVSGSITLGGDALTPYTGFRNAIINGDFRINQRAFTSLTAGAYFFDRWTFGNNTGTVTVSSQSFTVGSPAATGYESATFARQVTSGQSGVDALAYIAQNIEDVRTFANSTITISFWAKAASGTPKVAIELIQGFGSGGSPSSSVFTYVSQVTLSTSWTRYSVTTTVPNINGKTIGTTANTSSLQLQLWTSAGSNFNSRTGTLGVQNNTFDFWGVQVERGSVATPFEQRPIQTELALCQRYYHRHYSGDGNMKRCVIAQTYTYWTQEFFHPVEMRASPTVTIYNSALTAGNYDPDGGGVSNAVTARADKRGFAFYSAVNRNGEFWYTASAEF